MTRLGPPLSVRVKSLFVKMVVLIGELKLREMSDTEVLRGLGETAAMLAVTTSTEVEESDAALKSAVAA